LEGSDPGSSVEDCRFIERSLNYIFSRLLQKLLGSNRNPLNTNLICHQY